MQGMLREDLPHLTLRSGSRFGVAKEALYLVDDKMMFSHIGEYDVTRYRKWIANQRKLGQDVSQYLLYRMTLDTREFHHIDEFRYRPEYNDYGPDLQVNHNKQTNKRRNSIKNENYQILSFMMNGDLSSKLVCLDCGENLQGRKLMGFDTGFRGDIHHIVVFDNKSLCKGTKDPSKRLETTLLKDGKNPSSKSCLLDLMGCVTFCKTCHADWHSMFSKRSYTKHSDIRDYFPDGNDIRPWFIQTEENYQAFISKMKMEFNYSDLPTYTEWLDKLQLPSHLELKWK